MARPKRALIAQLSRCPDASHADTATGEFGDHLRPRLAAEESTSLISDASNTIARTGGVVAEQPSTFSMKRRAVA